MDRILPSSFLQMSRYCLLAGAICVCMGVMSTPVSVSAQGSPADVSQTTASGVVLRSNTNLVLLDVVVDEKGRAAHSIDKRRFHVFEDGKEREISSLDEHITADGAQPLKQTVLPAHVYSNQPLYPAQAAVNVLLLDGLNTTALDQMRTRQQMLEYLGTIPPGTPLAIFTLTSKLRLVQGFTTEPATLVAALKSSKALPQQTTLQDAELTGSPVSVANGGSMSEGGGDGSGLRTPGALQLFASDIAAVQTDLRVRTTMDALRSLARYLDGIPGRKNLIWFSGSFPVSMDPEKVTSDSFRGMQDYSEELRKTSVAMNAARVAVYPVDARGLMTLPSYDVAYRPSNSANRGGQSSAMARDNNAATDSLLAEHFAMEQLAEDTGGRAFVNTGDFKGAVAEAIGHGGSYYSLAFTPATKGEPGKFHKLRVKVDGGSYVLAYRHGYFADDRGMQGSRLGNGLMNEATQRGVPQATEIVFEARVLAADGPELKDEPTVRSGGSAGAMAASFKGLAKRYVVDVRLDAASLAFSTDAQGTRKAQVELALVAYDGDGVRVNTVDQGLGLNLTSEQYLRMTRSGIPLRALIDLPGGPVFLRVAIRDIGAAKVGSLEVPLMVAKK